MRVPDWMKILKRLDLGAYGYLMGRAAERAERGDEPFENSLLSRMAWTLTPQGHSYWQALHSQITDIQKSGRGFINEIEGE